MKNQFKQAFYDIYNQVSNDMRKPNCNNFYTGLDYAKFYWSQKFNFNSTSINQEQKKIEPLINYLEQELRPVKTLNLLMVTEKNSQLFNIINNIFSNFNIKGDLYINFIVILGFMITAVSYCIDLINQSEQNQNLAKSTVENKTSLLSNENLLNTSTLSSITSKIPENITKSTVKKSVILVISAKHKSVIDDIKINDKINQDDCKKLYEITKYLCQDVQTDIASKWQEIDQFKVVEPSEYDIYLINIELNQEDENFDKNVHPLDRYDAFRNLYNLAVKFEVSPRLQMEAYQIFNVYNR